MPNTYINHRPKLHLPGTTIMESVIAMTIIAIAFAVGMMVVEMVLNSNKAAFKYRVRHQLVDLAQHIKETQDYLDDDLGQIDFFIEKRLIPHEVYPDVYRLQLTAKDLQERVVENHQLLIYIP